MWVEITSSLEHTLLTTNHLLFSPSRRVMFLVNDTFSLLPLLEANGENLSGIQDI